MAGRLSVKRLINSRCTGANGTGSPKTDAQRTVRIAPKFPDKRNWIAFLMFWYRFRPFSTAFTIVAKLSSVSTIAAASLATSVPVTPIATPISACFNAGASFTPSPVIATIFPLCCHARTIRILCSGETLAYTEMWGTNSFSWSSLIFSISAPSQASDRSWRIPIRFAIAAAVILWSPVIITGRIPAFIHSATAAFDSSLGGSIIAISPRNTRWFSSSAVNICLSGISR